MQLGDFAVVFDLLPSVTPGWLTVRPWPSILVCRSQQQERSTRELVQKPGWTMQGVGYKSQAAGSRDLNTQIFSLTLQYFLRLSLEGAVWASGSSRFLPVTLIRFLLQQAVKRRGREALVGVVCLLLWLQEARALQREAWGRLRP